VIKKFRARAKTTAAGDLAWRIGVAVLGGCLTALGEVFMITPGPGWLVIFAGLGILASEFAWAERALIKTNMVALRAARRALPLGKRRLYGAIAVVVIALILFLLWTIRQTFA